MQVAGAPLSSTTSSTMPTLPNICANLDSEVIWLADDLVGSFAENFEGMRRNAWLGYS